MEHRINIMNEEIKIPAAEVKLDEDQGPLKVLTMQDTPLTDHIQQGSHVGYRRRSYQVVEKQQRKEMTAAVVNLSLRLVEKGTAHRKGAKE